MDAVTLVDDLLACRPGALVLAAPSLPAGEPERLDTIEALAAGWLLRFGPNTRDAYACDLRQWLAWCDELNVDPLRRHAFTTLALDVGVALRDVQDAMGHADPRTTRRYERSRHSLNRHATYAVAAYVSQGEG